MVKKSRSRKGVSKSKIVEKVRKTQLPLNTYEEWLKRQTVKPAVRRSEVQVPLDSYEEWIRRQVKKRLE